LEVTFCTATSATARAVSSLEHCGFIALRAAASVARSAPLSPFAAPTAAIKEADPDWFDMQRVPQGKSPLSSRSLRPGPNIPAK
jgi:hypothetical protein